MGRRRHPHVGAGAQAAVAGLRRPKLRAWVIEHFRNGTVERLEIATNAPWVTLKPSGPPVPDDGMSGEIAGTVTLRPVDTLPAIRDADMVAHHRAHRDGHDRAAAMSSCPPAARSRSPTAYSRCPTPRRRRRRRARFRLEGRCRRPSELAGMEPLRDAAGIQLDPATTPRRGHRAGHPGDAAHRNLPKGSVDLQPRRRGHQLRRPRSWCAA